MARIAVIGSGFAGLSAATTLADQGHEVHLYEQHSQTGGRARTFSAEGFTFDMGPSWYWMPDVFENYFGYFGKKPSDYYDLKRLDPSYRVWFGKDDAVDIPADYGQLRALFEEMEPGAAVALDAFLEEARVKYETGMNDLVHKPSLKLTEFMDVNIALKATRLHLFRSLSQHVRKFFKHPRILQILEFPVLFLGAKPEKTPALYSLMNYADIKLGTWYPMGGMHKIVEGMTALAREKGVHFHLGASVERIPVLDGHARGVLIGGNLEPADAVIAGADYHHVEQHLLDAPWRSYNASYWDSRVMSPSSLLFYVGINKRIPGLDHHTLCFDTPFGPHAADIYDHPQWPKDPLFYVCAPSVTDPSVAPEGSENLFFLVPIAPGLEDTDATREKYWKMIVERFEQMTGEDVTNHIVYKRSYAVKDFEDDYNAFKGNAYGLANTLRQTAFLKPKLKSKKVDNLYFAGQLTTPGPGVPPSLISGQVAAHALHKQLLKEVLA